MKSFVFLFFVVNLTACVTLLEVPGHMNPPTTLGKGVLNASVIVAEEPQVLFSDFRSEDEILSRYSDPNVRFKIGFGITDRIDTHLLTTTSKPLNFSSLSLNYQWLGTPIYKTKQGNLNSTVRLKFIRQFYSRKEIPASFSDENMEIIGFIGSNGKTIDSIEYTVKGLGFSLSNSFGYMVSDWFSIYGGGRAFYILVHHEIKEEIIWKDEKNSKTDDSRLWYFGPFIGIQLNTTGSIWKVAFIIESNLTYIPSSAGIYKKNERYWIQGFSSSLNVLYQF